MPKKPSDISGKIKAGGSSTELAKANELTFDANLGQRLTRPTVLLGSRAAENDEAVKLWEAIRSHTDRISFPEFDRFVRDVLCDEAEIQDPCNPDYDGEDGHPMRRLDPAGRRRLYPSRWKGAYRFFPGTDAYSSLRVAAEVFLLLNCGICPPRDQQPTDIFRLPENPLPDDLASALSAFLGNDHSSYIRHIIESVFPDHSITLSPFCGLTVGFGPCLLELIWSYWHEQGMLAQTMNTMALRFQNVRVKDRDPLAELEVDPLRPLGGFLWGYIQSERDRLSVPRRAYEYSHHYGLELHGRAVSKLRPADPRSQFLRSFHDLLRAADNFYREASDNTISAEPFPVLVALRDLHMILAEGAHNQFRDLPWTSRVEMLVEQWLLARDETRDFLRGRYMVPYREGWMGAVDAMKRLQGWMDTSVSHFNDLAVFGERLLLSVRYTGWSVMPQQVAQQAAYDWALTWRPEVLGYIHAYRIATGVNLSDDVVEVSRMGDSRYRQPSFHLQERLDEQRPGPALTDGAGNGARLQQRALPRPVPRQR